MRGIRRIPYIQMRSKVGGRNVGIASLVGTTTLAKKGNVRLSKGHIGSVVRVGGGGGVLPPCAMHGRFRSYFGDWIRVKHFIIRSG